MAERATPQVEIDPSGLRPRPGHQDVLDFLRREIQLGRLRPGDRLPAERALAAHLGVARETLRLALRGLEKAGQLRTIRGAAGGSIIQQTEPNLSAIWADVEARGGQIIELSEFRSVVESATARLAATRASSTDLARLESAQRELSAAGSTAESRIADTAFHLAVAAAAGNRFLLAAVEDARSRMFEPVDLLPFEFMKESSLAAHQRVLDAIRAREPDAAAEAMSGHLAGTRSEFERLIEGGRQEGWVAPHPDEP